MTSNVTFQESTTVMSTNDPRDSRVTRDPMYYISTTDKVLEMIALVSIGSLSLVGNVGLWMVILGSRALRTTSNFLVLYLSSADLLVSLINTPITGYFIVNGGGSGISNTGCVIVGFISMFIFAFSINALGLISFNRYVLICHPQKYPRIFSTVNLGLMMGGIVVLTGFMVLPPVFGWGRYAFSPSQSTCFCDWPQSKSYTLFLVSICFFGSISCMCFCYIRIIQTVRESNRKIQSKRMQYARVKKPTIGAIPEKTREKKPTIGVIPEKIREAAAIPIGQQAEGKSNAKKSKQELAKKDAIPDGLGNSAIPDDWDTEVIPKETEVVDIPDDSNDSPNDEISSKSISKRVEKRNAPGHVQTPHKKVSRKREELKLTLLFLLIITALLVCWTPNCVTLFISLFADVEFPRSVAMTTILLGFFNSGVNPIIYGFMNKTYVEAFFQMLLHWKRK